MNNNNKELISQDTLYDIMYNYIKPELDKCKENGALTYGFQEGVFYWHLYASVGSRFRSLGSHKCENHWEIYNDYYKEENVNIKIFNDHIEFIEDSKFKDFSRDKMYSLYTFLNERIFGIKEKENDDETKMNNNKKLISLDELKEIMYNYLKPELDKCNSSNCTWHNVSQAGVFDWTLISGVGRHSRTIGSRLCNDHFDIYNNLYDDKHINIKIFNDHVEFIEESEFNDFDKEFMRGLYDKIIEYIEYNNTTNRVAIEIDLDRDKNDLSKLMGSFHNIFTGQTEYVNNDIVLSSDKPFNGEEFDGNVAEIIYNLTHEGPDSISRMLNDLKKAIDSIAYNNLQEPEFYEYIREYNTYADKLYDNTSSDNGKITRKKRDVPVETIKEICKDNGVEWKPNNDNPNNNIKVDSNAEVNTFGDGAVRSSKKGKGRYDLIPGCVMVDVINSLNGTINNMDKYVIKTYKSILLKSIYEHNWVSAIAMLTVLGYHDENTTHEIDTFNKMQKDLALHYENGAEIYGENNWKKGIPIESFISSGIRHTQQWLSGLDDEPHLISAIWNFTNAAWCEHKEKLYK